MAADTFRALFVPAELTEAVAEVTLTLTPAAMRYDEVRWHIIQNVIVQTMGYGPSLFLEFVRTDYLDSMRIGDYNPEIHVVMAMDEDAINNGRPINPRASVFYPSAVHAIYGNVVILAEDHSDPFMGYEIVSLHDCVTPKTFTEHSRRILPSHPHQAFHHHPDKR